MPKILDIELIISDIGGKLVAGLRIELASTRANLAHNVPITLNNQMLLAVSNIPSAYGAALTEMVFQPELREAWQRARGFIDGKRKPARVRLVLEGDDTLHSIRWELLCDPLDQMPIAYNERVRFSRFLSSPNTSEIEIHKRRSLRAVIAVASPTMLSKYGLAVVDVDGEVARAKVGLGKIPTTVLDGKGEHPSATLAAITDEFRNGAQILYLVCHGKIIEGQSYLWLEKESEDNYSPIEGEALIQAIARLQHRPLLIVLASCQGAGDTYNVLTAIGPKLAQCGVGVVIAMQGDVPMDFVQKFTPLLFRELQRDGQFDRALAATRAKLPRTSPWWMPVLWMSIRDGSLWRDDRYHKRVIALSCFAVIVLIVSSIVGYQRVVLAPLPPGWNIVVAGIGVERNGVVVADSVGVNYSICLASVLERNASHIRDVRHPNVGTVYGDERARHEQATEIANRNNADIVIYGVITDLGSGAAEYHPEFYIDRSAAPFAAEIGGPEQFGEALSFNTENDCDTVSLDSRMTVIRPFFEGLQEYSSGLFANGRSSLERARAEALKAESPHTAAVIATFAGALEESARTAGKDGDYERALQLYDQSINLWDRYPRPYLGRAAVLYQLARSELVDGVVIDAAPAAKQDACDKPINPVTLSPGEKLQHALICLEKASELSLVTPTADINIKTKFSRAEILLLLSSYTNLDHWDEAQELFQDVINQYNASSEATQVRVKRLAAHSYARIGLAIICRPNCDNPAQKTQPEYERAEVMYRQAVQMLREIADCVDVKRTCHPTDAKSIAVFETQISDIEQYITSLQP